MMQKIIIILFHFLLFSQLGISQINYCDSLFLKNGDTLLISVNHSTFKSKILYNDCFDKGSRKSIKKSELIKFSLNNVLLNTKNTKRNYIAKITLNNKQIKKGRLYAVDDKSILLLKEEGYLEQYAASNIKRIQVHKKQFKVLCTVTGALVGVVIGAGWASSQIGGQSTSGGIMLGALTGASVGALVGNGLSGLGVRLKINGDTKKYRNEIKRLKFY